MFRFETALGALGALTESVSAEAHILRDVLKHARRSAQEQPISAQIKETEEFIARSTHRLQVLAQKRKEEEKLLDNAKARLERSRFFSFTSHAPDFHTELDVQVAELKAKLVLAEAERDDKARHDAHCQRDAEMDNCQQDRVPKWP